MWETDRKDAGRMFNDHTDHCAVCMCVMLCVCRQPVAPVDIRAMAVKAEFADIEKLKTQMLSKDEVVNKMKQLLKAKVRCCCCCYLP